MGCGGGGGGQSTTTEHGQTAKTRYLVAALGDSITAGTPGWDPNPAIRSELGLRPNRQSQYEYWAHRAVPRVRFRNCGVPGERTDQIRARLAACARRADALIVQGGVNDIAQALGRGGPAMVRAVNAAAKNLRAMVSEGKRLGLRVLVANVLPWNAGHPDADGPIAYLNRYIARLGSDEHVPVLAFHDTLERPPGSGLMRPDLTVEGSHPSIDGYALLGQDAVAPALRRLSAGAPRRGAHPSRPQ